MRELERVSDAMYRGYFVDLFVRTSNATAIQMYAKLGYAVYRCVLAARGQNVVTRCRGSSSVLDAMAQTAHAHTRMHPATPAPHRCAPRRRVLAYYSDEDAFDMRKACSRDREKLSVVPLPRPVTAEEMRAARL